MNDNSLLLFLDHKLIERCNEEFYLYIAFIQNFFHLSEGLFVVRVQIILDKNMLNKENDNCQYET